MHTRITLFILTLFLLASRPLQATARYLPTPPSTQPLRLLRPAAQPLARPLTTVQAPLEPSTPQAEEGAWPMVAADPQRTSWSSADIPDDGLPLGVEWYRPIEAYIPQNVQIIAAHGLLYVATSAGLYALDAATGAVAWRYDTRLPLGNSPTVADGVVYVGGYDRSLHALDATTGRLLWRYSGAGAGFATNPLVVDGQVIAGNRDGGLYAIGAHGTDQAGQLLWKFQAGGPILQSPAYADGVVYFAANDNRAYAVNAADGSLGWRSDTLPGIQYQSYWPVIYGDLVIFAASDGYRAGLRPGTLSADCGRFGLLQIADLFEYTCDTDSALWPEGETLGPEVGPQPWSHGYPVVDVSPRMTEYLEDNPNPAPFRHKPWRRVLIALHRADGREFTFDSDGDGYPEYLPANWWGTGSGNRYPPIVGPDGLLYFSNAFRCCSDAKGYIMGWQPATPTLLSVTEGFGALAEPQAISGGGRTIFRNLCCDRVGDYFAMDEPRSRRELWSYNLEELAPGYDQMWTVLEGLPRLQGWYRGATQSVNAAYHNHGDQNPIIPYQGRLYVHRSNAVLAFAPRGLPAGGAHALPALTIQPPASQPTQEPSRSELVARLEAEVGKILAAGDLRPGYYNVYAFLVRGLEDYFANPGETLYTLTRAYPFLSSGLQAETATYLHAYFDRYFAGRGPYPPMVAHVGWADGAPRENMLLPAEVEADLANFPASTQAGPGFTWTYPQVNFYALWQYARLFPERASEAYDLAKSRLQVPLPNGPADDYYAQQPYELNGYIAGYLGFLGLQELAGAAQADAALRSQVQQELDRLIQLRIDTFDKDSYWAPGPDTPRIPYYKKHFDLARNFVYLTPELADPLYRAIPGQIDAALDEYTRIAPYWFVGRYEGVIGEGVLSNLYNAHALFQAKAMLQGAAPQELARYLDVPAFLVGDLFYIQNLTAVLERDTLVQHVIFLPRVQRMGR
ncbi:PQQ-like beta-propeller repeat protein [Litorilinea aerophila]|uniref:PQQ-binding-like beta-propeller repeat protein n=1 Tax=Litorilinea aerophila TaxID=1204385 RepID=A0A540VB43_9CHLR|nr:PQQ-binding-like beta-propeller repeat protein [Litorilinea aerophila]MCC9078136.1 PQQ-like beta-propeller repeat protein [Litorilinea aerophila]